MIGLPKEISQKKEIRGRPRTSFMIRREKNKKGLLKSRDFRTIRKQIILKIEEDSALIKNHLNNLFLFIVKR